MIALKAEDVKSFTTKLFVREDFDAFLVKEVNITTYNSFSIDGHVKQGYYTEEEREENNIEEFSTWKTLRPFCFSLIKGKKLPGSFRIVLQLPKAGTDKFSARTGAWIDGNQIVGLYLNIRYDNGEMYCITGTSLNFFTMDKTLDLEWDKAVKQFLQSHEIPCTEATEGYKQEEIAWIKTIFHRNWRNLQLWQRSVRTNSR